MDYRALSDDELIEVSHEARREYVERVVARREMKSECDEFRARVARLLAERK